MFQVIIKIILTLIILTGARIITKRFFSFGDQNEASSGLKILGFLVAIIGGLILYFNI